MKLLYRHLVKLSLRLSSRDLLVGSILFLFSSHVFAAQRFIALAPNLTEIVYAAGAGDQLVGVSAYSNYPTAALHLPQVSSYAGIDVESVLALKPSMILALQNENSTSQLQLLKQSRVVIQTFQINTFADVLNAIDWVGKQAGTEQAARQKVGALRSQYESFVQHYAHQRPLKVLYLISINPALTLNENNLVSSMIYDCGGLNIYAKLKGAAPQISWSSVLTIQPDVILVAHDSTKRNDIQQILQQWPELKAVREHHVFYVNADWTNRPGPRSLLGMQQICTDLVLAR